MTIQVCSVGEVMAEIRQSAAGFAVGFAGDTYNTAVYLRRALGAAAAVSFHSRLGSDPLSKDFLSTAAREGLDVSSISFDPSRNIGIYAVQTDEQGERTFAYWRDQSAARRLFETQEDFDRLADVDLLYLSGITLAVIAESARAALLDWIAGRRRHGVRLAFDSNYRPRLWESADVARRWMERAWRLADIGFPSIDDEAALFGSQSQQDILARLQGWGCISGALKRGAEGPVSLVPGAAPSRFAAAARVVDTTAAGDSFNGAYLAAILRGEPDGVALSAGHAQAVEVIGHPGAIIPRAPAAS